MLEFHVTMDAPMIIPDINTSISRAATARTLGTATLDQCSEEAIVKQRSKHGVNEIWTHSRVGSRDEVKKKVSPELEAGALARRWWWCSL